MEIKSYTIIGEVEEILNNEINLAYTDQRGWRCSTCLHDLFRDRGLEGKRVKVIIEVQDE